MTRRVVKKYHTFSTWSVFKGSLGEFRARVSRWVEEYGADAEIDCLDNEIYITQPPREETDEEYRVRLELEEQVKERQEVQDRIEWERLKKKFG